MSTRSKVVIHLSSGPEAVEQVTLAFQIAEAAVRSGHQVAIFLARDGVRLAEDGVLDSIYAEHDVPLSRLTRQYTDAGGALLASRGCWRRRGKEHSPVVAGVRFTSGTALWDWIGPSATVFSF